MVFSYASIKSFVSICIAGSFEFALVCLQLPEPSTLLDRENTNCRAPPSAQSTDTPEVVFWWSADLLFVQTTKVGHVNLPSKCIGNINLF